MHVLQDGPFREHLSSANNLSWHRFSELTPRDDGFEKLDDLDGAKLEDLKSSKFERKVSLESLENGIITSKVGNSTVYSG